MLFKSVENFYKFQAGFYDLTRSFFLFHRKDPIKLSQLEKGQHVLEIGCGTGHNFYELYNYIGPEGTITGVDISFHMLKQADKRVKKNLWKNVDLHNCSINKFSTNVTYDFILFSYSLTIIEDWKNCLKKITTLLAPKGKIGVVDFQPLSTTFPILGNALSKWFTMCHVDVNRKLSDHLQKTFNSLYYHSHLYGYAFVFVGSARDDGYGC